MPYINYSIIDKKGEIISSGQTWTEEGQILELDPNYLYLNYEIFDSHKKYLDFKTNEIKIRPELDIIYELKEKTLKIKNVINGCSIFVNQKLEIESWTGEDDVEINLEQPNKYIIDIHPPFPYMAYNFDVYLR